MGNRHSALRRGIQNKQHRQSLAAYTGFRVGARNDDYLPTVLDAKTGEVFACKKIIFYTDYMLKQASFFCHNVTSCFLKALQYVFQK